MKTSQALWRYANAIGFGLVIAFIVSWAVSRFWPSGRLVVFIAVFFWWLMGVAQVVKRETREGDDSDSGIFKDPENWTSARLPIEFQSITRQTTLDDVIRKIGPCTRVTSTGLVRYDLPSGDAIVIFPEVPFKNTSVVKGIQVYRPEYD